MPIEKAIPTAMIRCQKIIGIIESYEAGHQCMDGWHRSELGAWRAFLSLAGVESHLLPETPYLNPAHLEAWRAQREKRVAEAIRRQSTRREEVA